MEQSGYKCPICLDPRQYIGPKGQKWTTLPRIIQQEKYRNDFAELIEGHVWTVRTQPAFGIGQRAFLIKDDGVDGLVMWDCIAYLDDETLARIDQLSDGRGIAHMVVSHPHYYSTTAIWAAAFPRMKLWLAKVDFPDWYQREDIKAASVDKQASPFAQSVANQLRWVEEEQTKLDAAAPFTILLLGGHFPGSLVLLWRDALFIADTIQVSLLVCTSRSSLCCDRLCRADYTNPASRRDKESPLSPFFGGASVPPARYFFIVRCSYPNLIPLSAAEVKRVCQPLEKVSFTQAFGAFEGFNIWGQAKEKILQSRDIIVRRLEM